MLIASLRAAAQRRGKHPVFVTQTGESISAGDLLGGATATAVGLAEAGVSERDLVAIDLPSDVGYLLTYLGCASLGAVAAGLNRRLTHSERADLVDGVEPDWIVTDTPELWRHKGPHIIPVTTSAHPDEALLELRSASSGRGNSLPPLPPDPDRPVAVVFTSGTTGRPKAAVFGESQIEAITLADTGGALDIGGRVIAATSFAHVGFMTKLAGNLALGTTMFMIDRWRARNVLRAVEDLGLTAVTGVPTQIALMVRDELWVTPPDVTSVRAIITGGGPLTPDVARLARQRFGAPLSNRYSSTETGVISATALDAPAEDAEVSVGFPRTGVTIEIRDPDDPARPTVEGEVCVRSAACMSGYYDDPAATAEVLLPDGFIRTRDLGAFDPQGRLALLGRTGDSFIRGGYNLHPAQIEAVLCAHPDLAAVAIVPVPDAVMGTVPVAVVVTRPGRTAPTASDLNGWASAELSKDKLPVEVIAIDELPYTAMNKLDRSQLTRVACKAQLSHE